MTEVGSGQDCVLSGLTKNFENHTLYTWFTGNKSINNFSRVYVGYCTNCDKLFGRKYCSGFLGGFLDNHDADPVSPTYLLIDPYSVISSAEYDGNTVSFDHQSIKS